MVSYNRNLFMFHGKVLAIIIGVIVIAFIIYKQITLMIIIGIINLLLFTYLWPAWPLFVAPWATIIWIPLIKESSYTITVLDIIVVIMIVEIIFAIIGIWPHKRKIQKFALEIFILAYLPLLPAIFGGVITLGPNALIRSFLIFTKRWAEYSIYPLAAVLFLSVKDTKKIAYSLGSISILLGISAFLPSIKQAIMKYVGMNHITIVYNEINPRATGLLFNPNIYGDLLVFSMNFIVSIMIVNPPKNIFSMLFLVLSFLTALISFPLSGSREALVGLIVSIIFWYIWVFHRRKSLRFYKLFRRFTFIIFFSVVSILVMFRVSHKNILIERVREVIVKKFSAYNAAKRLAAESIGFHIFLDHPLGVGIGNIGLIGNEYVNDYGSWLIQSFGGTDSQYLDPLIEGGLLGLFFLLLVLWKIYKRNRKRNDYFSVSVRVNIIALTFIGFFGYSFYAPPLASMLWLLIGVSEVTGGIKHLGS